MEQRLLGWLARYGLQAVFGLQVLGIIGLPVPDEIMLTVAGTFVRAGKLPMAGTLAAAIGGCAAGITLSYLAGRWVGLSAVRRVLHVPDTVLDRVQRWFRKAGRWLLTFGFFVPGVRHVTAVAAGSSGLGFRQFACYAYAGAVLWASTFVIAGYVLGDRWRPAVEGLRAHVRLAIAIVVGAYVARLVANRLCRRLSSGSRPNSPP